MNNVSQKNVFSIISFCMIFFSGCAFDLVHINQVPTQINSMESSRKSWRLINAIELRLDTGYSRKLKGETKWDHVGKIKQGDVYKTTDQILTVEGSNIFEAYIVVFKDQLVGFYLPVEKTYVSLPSSKKLEFEIIN